MIHKIYYRVSYISKDPVLNRKPFFDGFTDFSEAISYYRMLKKDGYDGVELFQEIEISIKIDIPENENE